MTPGEARELATLEMSSPVINAASKRVDLTFDYDEMKPNVVAALIARSDLGKQRYGTYLHTWNNRDPSADLIQELVDALIYAQQDLLEHEYVYGVCSSAPPEVREENAALVAHAAYRRNTIMKLLEGLLA